MRTYSPFGLKEIEISLFVYGLIFGLFFHLLA